MRLRDLRKSAICCGDDEDMFFREAVHEALYEAIPVAAAFVFAAGRFWIVLVVCFIFSSINFSKVVDKSRGIAYNVSS